MIHMCTMGGGAWKVVGGEAGLASEDKVRLAVETPNSAKDSCVYAIIKRRLIRAAHAFFSQQ